MKPCPVNPAIACLESLSLAACMLMVAVLVPGSAAMADPSPDGWSARDGESTAALRAIWGTSGTDLFTAGENGTILHWDGVHWASMDSGYAGTLSGIWGSCSADVFAVGSNGQICHYDGTGWSTMSSGVSRHLQGVWGTAADDVYAVGYGGTILHYDGLTWIEMENASTSHLASVWGSTTEDVFAAGNNGVVLHYDGAAWTAMLENTHPNFCGIWGSASDNVFAVGGGGVVLNYDGLSWNAMDSGLTGDLSDVWGLSSTDVFATGLDGTVLHYDGSSWTKMDTGVSASLQAIYGFSSCDVYAAGYNGCLIHYRDLPPVISGVFPNKGNPGESLTITITGAELNGEISLSLGDGIVIGGFQAQGSTQVTASITIDPGAAPGPRTVSVTTPNGAANLSGAFTVVPAPAPPGTPAIAGMDPRSGKAGQTLSVTITGANLANAVSIDFGSGITVAEYNALANAITAVVSISWDATVGSRDISLTTPGGTVTLASGFTVYRLPPVIFGINPAHGEPGETLDVLVTGSNFTGTTSVDFGEGTRVNSFEVDSDTQLTANISILEGAEGGLQNVRIATPAGTVEFPAGFDLQIGGEPSSVPQAANPGQSAGWVLPLVLGGTAAAALGCGSIFLLAKLGAR